MRGLLKNDFFAVCTNAKVFSVFMLLFGVFSVVVTSQSIQMYFVMIGIVGFSVNVVAVLNNEYASKWGKYKLTLPVKRADIVKSLFLNHIIWLLIGTIFAGTGIVLSWLIHGYPFHQYFGIFSTFTSGISISLFMGAIFIPLFYSGGEEKSIAFLIIAFLCAVGITSLLRGIADASPLIGSVIMYVCPLLTFALSYPLSVGIFKRKKY